MLRHCWLINSEVNYIRKFTIINGINEIVVIVLIVMITETTGRMMEGRMDSGGGGETVKVKDIRKSYTPKAMKRGKAAGRDSEMLRNLGETCQRIGERDYNAYIQKRRY